MVDAVRLNEFIQGASRLPVLPKITARLLNTLDSPDSSSKDIAAIVEAEPALAARLLKLANSSFYGQRGQISTVNTAVVVLGSKTIRSLALTVWTHTLRAQARNTGEMAMLAPLLAHGLAAGVAARMLAERTRRALGEDAFMAGLLHDIGRVALVAQLGMGYRTRILDPALHEGVPLHEKESATLGFDHRALGAALMTSWALPSFLIDVAEKHHDSGIVPGDQFFVAATALADNYSTRLGFNLAPGLPRPEQEELAVFFGLADQEAVAEFLELCVSKVGTISAVLEKTR
ncbi:MAG: HDOD domain-containing protein [Rhodocyclaceae bacterium]|nr:HDOD domain-containing protein [Rhodocyclaceae bacterium]